MSVELECDNTNLNTKLPFNSRIKYPQRPHPQQRAPSYWIHSVSTSRSRLCSVQTWPWLGARSRTPPKTPGVSPSSRDLPSSSSTPPMGAKSSSSAGETDDGGAPIHASRGGGEDVDSSRKRESSGIRVRVDSRARVYMPSMSSVGRQIRGTPASS